MLRTIAARASAGNDHVMQQAKEFLRCANNTFRNENITFLLQLDWSSGPAAVADDALVAAKMGVKHIEKQPKMRLAQLLDDCPAAKTASLRQPGSWQSMALEADQLPFDRKDQGINCEGEAKGLKQALWERGLWRGNMRMKGKKSKEGKLVLGDCAPKAMAGERDFQWEPCALSELINEMNQCCLFTPKLHPEV